MPGDNQIPEAVTNLASELNGILVNFIKNHESAITYLRTSDGYSFIFIDYGKYRISEMNKIKEFINCTEYDALLKIVNIPVECVNVTDSVILFKGLTTDVDQYLANNISNSDIANIIVKAKVISAADSELIETYDDLVADILEKFVTNKSTLRLETIKSSGLSYSEENEDYGYFGIEVEKVAKYIAKYNITEKSEKSGLGIKNDFNNIYDLNEFVKKTYFYRDKFPKGFKEFVNSDTFKTTTKATIDLITDSKIIIKFDLTEYKEVFSAENTNPDPTYISVADAGFVALTAEQIAAGVPEQDPPTYYVLADGVTEETITSAEDFVVAEITEFAENVTYYVAL